MVDLLDIGDKQCTSPAQPTRGPIRQTDPPIPRRCQTRTERARSDRVGRSDLVVLNLVIPLDDTGVAGGRAGAGTAAGLGVAGWRRRDGRDVEAAVALALGRRRRRRRLVLAVDGAALARRLLELAVLVRVRLVVVVVVASAGRWVVEAGVGGFAVHGDVGVGFLGERVRVFGNDVPGVQQAGELSCASRVSQPSCHNRGAVGRRRGGIQSPACRGRCL